MDWSEFPKSTFQHQEPSGKPDLTEYKFGDRVEIISGRLKGETGTVLGETNLNTDHLWIVRREKKGIKKKKMGFHTWELSIVARKAEGE